MKREPQARRRILVVDDHPIIRLGIRKMLSADASLSVSDEVDTAGAALRSIAATKPDLALIDLSLTDTPGLELLRLLHDTYPELPVLVLSMHDEELFAERVIKAGARGYVMKDQAIRELVQAIQQVISGKIYVSERIARRLLAREKQTHAKTDIPLDRLTNRELEVFDLIGRGMSTAALALELKVSIKTIETHRANIKRKLRLKDSVQLVRFAVSWSVRH
jgi:DNA-binding NarL/FixJ family response regulator